MDHILAIDQGTTSTRAIIFDGDMKVVASAQEEFKQIFPQSGWVEHDAEEIWETVLITARAALANAGLDAGDIAAIGITNQRETTVIWDRETGEPIHNAIVWQDRRTAPICEELLELGHEEMVTSNTGLLLDPYFSATKVKWILDKVDGSRERAAAGELAFGTMDSFLIWRLTGGTSHVTDATNAARTMLYDIHMGAWSKAMCELLDIPARLLPRVMNCADDFGTSLPEILGKPVRIAGVAGDQQAALVGQACFSAGMTKSTYGTGCFAIMNTGAKPVRSKNRLLTTIGYQLDGEVTYALEGSIFIAGAVVQWLRDGLKIIEDAKETQALAEAADDEQNVIMVPAFTGLGAPYWSPHSRGAIFGITRATSAAEFSRAALQSVGFQTRDLIEAMKSDWSDGDYSESEKTTLRVDGGMAANNYAVQFLADILGAPVDRPAVLETTALGAAWLAGMHVGLYPKLEDFAAKWSVDRSFAVEMDETTREDRYAIWRQAVDATISVRT